jgi:hypothetical protein
LLRIDVPSGAEEVAEKLGISCEFGWDVPPGLKPR